MLLSESGRAKTGTRSSELVSDLPKEAGCRGSQSLRVPVWSFGEWVQKSFYADTLGLMNKMKWDECESVL